MPSTFPKRLVTPVLALAGALFGLSACATREQARLSTVPVYQSPAVRSSAASQPLFTVNPPAAQPVWPLVLTQGSTNATVYEPEIDAWDGHHLVARSAVAMQSLGQAQPVYGVAKLSAITLVDKNTRTVSLAEAEISSADFPSAPQQTPAYRALLQAQFPKELSGLPLDRFEASLALPAKATAAPAQPLDNTPPKILVSTGPAVLVSIDGPPAYRPVPGTDLQRVINTRVLLFKNSQGEEYLHLLDGFMKAPALDGPWTVAQQVPAGASQVEQAANSDGIPVDLLQNEQAGQTNTPLSLTNGLLPSIYVATVPTELLTFDGPPEFVPIENTDLLYAGNTTGNVFKSTKDQKTYVLLSGRWYAADSMNGPWEFVPGGELPADFAKIPDSSPKENVKASVPGTRQANEALIANSIPQSSKVPLTTEMQNPQMDGAPQLRPIAGTPLSYVANSGTPIIKVNDQAWYACQNGVWFAAPSVNGPWSVATSIPDVIYTIPVTSPLHYLTYVQVYGSSPQAVYEGYTPGYMGTVVAPDGVVVYGTGYPYDPWIGGAWYSGPATWGYGWDPCWTPWDDWCFGLGFGWGFGFYVPAYSHHHYRGWHYRPPRPGWGPYRHFPHGRGFYAGRERGGHFVNTSHRVYSHPGLVTGRTAFEGRSAFRGHAYNSRTGDLLVGRHEAAPRVTGRYRNAGERPALWSRSGFGYSQRDAGFEDRVRSAASFRSAPLSVSRSPASSPVGRGESIREVPGQNRLGFGERPMTGRIESRPARSPGSAPARNWAAPSGRRGDFSSRPIPSFSAPRLQPGPSFRSGRSSSSSSGPAVRSPTPSRSSSGSTSSSSNNGYHGRSGGFSGSSSGHSFGRQSSGSSSRGGGFSRGPSGSSRGGGASSSRGGGGHR